MKHIPGSTFTVTNRKITGSVRNHFSTGTIYSIYNIAYRDGKLYYMFTDGTKQFELMFNNENEADAMISYLTQ